ncbi:MAG TPA: TatD family hydrolase [Candidatus Paceibacterota bacterium]|nr:TatD family hydrolase [Candidatus Paceibacterota bacterium]
MRPRFVDIHAHTNFAVFDADRGEVIKRALDAGVWMINIGIGEESSKKAVYMTAENPVGVYAIIGLHPMHANEEAFNADFYRSLAKNGAKVVGIGECGLDYYRNPSDEERARQKAAFVGQIELALELDLPLMLHIRSGEGGNAYEDVINMLKPYKEKYGDKLRGDAHFFAGSVKDAKEFLGFGFCLSYTGVVTFASQYKELVAATPIDRIMSETDCPYVAPVPERGKRNEPSFVIHTADHLIGMKGLGLEEGRKQLVDNAFRLWRL